MILTSSKKKRPLEHTTIEIVQTDWTVVSFDWYIVARGEDTLVIMPVTSDGYDSSRLSKKFLAGTWREALVWTDSQLLYTLTPRG